jgi:hypothetical protein
MSDDSRLIVTSLGVIEEIIFESQDLMNSSLEEGRSPKEGGGFVIKYDPNHASFKEALKVLVFVGAALESMWHQKAVEIKSKTFAEKTDRECKSVPIKFEGIGLTDSSLLDSMKNYYTARRHIVHEKAHDSKFQKTIFNAQTEANKAVELLKSVKLALGKLNS